MLQDTKMNRIFDRSALKLIVTKFGGTSNANAEQLRKLQSILDADKRRRIVVVSAPGKENSDDRKVTDLFYDCYTLASKGESIDATWARIVQRYTSIVADLGLELDLQSLFAQTKQAIERGASKEYCASRGEAIQAVIVANFLGATHVEAAQVIFFKQSGQLDEKRTYRAIRKQCGDPNKRYVIGGFYGTARAGGIQTFSRGGSDITGSIVAAALKASLYENWTDVAGVYTADPNKFPGARVIRFITYREVRELGYTGASVLHEDAVFPVRELGIPINVRNTNDPNADGTLIVSERDAGDEAVVGMAGKPGFVLFRVEKGRMNQQVGFASKLLAIFAKLGISVDHIPTGIDSMSVAVSQGSLGNKQSVVEHMIHTLLKPDALVVKHQVAIIALVGQGLTDDNRCNINYSMSKVLAEAGINTRYLDYGGSITFLVGVHDDAYHMAFGLIHDAFFPREEAA